MTGTPRTAAAIGEAIKSARKERGWSQTELGQRAGVSRPTIARIEQGKDGYTNVLDKVAAALNLMVSVQPED